MFVCLFAAKELAENSHVQDAFVIAVEQQAKERLERLSALRKIKPVDMTKLSQEVKQQLRQDQISGWGILKKKLFKKILN